MSGFKQRRPEAPDVGTEAIKVEEPPIYESVCNLLNVEDIAAFFTYDDVIYNPADLTVPADIIVHERVHMEQQRTADMTPQKWWTKWLQDPAFRLDQEAKAYGRQFQFLCTYKKDRNERTRILVALARSLSGRLYDNAVTHSEAMTLIKRYAGV